ncbi:hypothetical protein BD779DRAFT_618492 [Infundibulicybe gibba]|nr:hypothetical protein BD779DRAFT_618492 [Infundibulicybe gibba]
MGSSLSHSPLNRFTASFPTVSLDPHSLPGGEPNCGTVAESFRCFNFAALPQLDEHLRRASFPNCSPSSRHIGYSWGHTGEGSLYLTPKSYPSRNATEPRHHDSLIRSRYRMRWRGFEKRLDGSTLSTLKLHRTRTNGGSTGRRAHIGTNQVDPRLLILPCIVDTSGNISPTVSHTIDGVDIY